MQTISGLLGGMGLFGLIGVILLGFILFAIVPIWAIFDCACSKRSGGTKALIIILLFLFWGLGSLIYSVFLTDSKFLRRLTVITICGSILLTIFSFSSLTGGAVISRRIADKEKLSEQQKIISEFKPDPIDINAITPFRAVNFTHDGGFPSAASAARFTIAGPDPAAAFNINNRVRHLIHDERDDRYYALTQHDFGRIDPVTGNFDKIAIDPGLAGDFSWPKGLAFDAENSEVVILTSHVDSTFYGYNLKTQAWRKITTIKRGGFIALSYSPEDQLFYALEAEHGKTAISSIRKFNRQGADFGSVDIAPPIPIAPGQDEYFQMACSSGRIVLIIPPALTRRPNDYKQVRIFVVDPKNGKLFVPKS